MATLFTPLPLGSLELPNRVVMAPLTRVRSGREGAPNDLDVEHYAQRATVGLIVTEGTYPSAADSRTDAYGGSRRTGHASWSRSCARWPRRSAPTG